MLVGAPHAHGCGLKKVVYPLDAFLRHETSRSKLGSEGKDSTWCIHPNLAFAAELQALQASCQPNHPLADIAVVEIRLGEANSLFKPVTQPVCEDQAVPPAPVAAAPAAKAPAKGAAAKGPAGKGHAGKAAAVAAADQPPPLGASEMGRALELVGSQVQAYYAWREAAKVMDLPEEPLTPDQLAGFRALMQDAPQVGWL